MAMDQSDLVLAHSRKEAYSFLYSCLSHDPSFQYILSLLGDHIDRCFTNVKGKESTKVRKRVREDYDNLLSHSRGELEVIIGVLRQMQELINKEIEILQTNRRDRITSILLIQKKMLEEQISTLPLKKLRGLSSTEFYSSLLCTIHEFLVIDHKRLAIMIYCIA